MLKGTQKRLQTFANKLFHEFSDIVKEVSVSEIYNDNSILFNFSKEDVKYISSLALLIYYKSERKWGEIFILGC